MGSGFASRLEAHMAAYKYSLDYAWGNLSSAYDRRARFISYFVEVYHYVKLSCPLMEVAWVKLAGKAPEVREYLGAHIEEERGHELWVLKDLERLGVNTESVARGTPRRETQNLLGSQLYVIHHLNPLGFLGYIYALESRPPTAEFLDWLSRRFSLPLEALSTFERHAEADPHHISDLKQIIELEVIDPDAEDLILDNMRHTVENLADLIAAVAASGEAPEAHSAV